MRDPPPVVRRREILLAVELLAGEHVPQPEFRLQAAVALPRDAAGDQRLRVDRAPVGKTRHVIAIGDLLDEGGRIDRRKQPAALQIVADHARDIAPAYRLPDRKSGSAIGIGCTLP